MTNKDMEILSSKTNNRVYDIYLGNEISVLEIIEQKFERSEKFVLVTDEKINSLYKEYIESLLENLGKSYIKIVVGEGERFKSLESLKFIYENLISSNIHRNDVLIAFGGGMIGDLAGFAASTFHRGIKLVQFPTTLLAQVDSSVGGKVVVNYKDLKNIIGSYYQPHMVLSDQSFLKTLDIGEIKNGLSEIVKYGLAFDEDILEYFENIGPDSLRVEDIKEMVQRSDFLEIIKKCVKIKKSVVERDEFDEGERNYLNFGHTIGHALEKIGDLEVTSHGEAISIGMMVALKLSIYKGLLDEDIYERVLAVFKKIGLSYKLPEIDIEELIRLTKFDKKSTGSKKKYILLEGLNNPRIEDDVEDNMIYKVLIENKKG